MPTLNDYKLQLNSSEIPTAQVDDMSSSYDEVNFHARATSNISKHREEADSVV